MYSALMMMALSGSAATPDCCFQSFSCAGCWGSGGGCWGSGCHGWGGGCWGSGCHGWSGGGCHGWRGGWGCHGCWGSSCAGCSGGCGGGMRMTPAPTPGGKSSEPVPAPKKKEGASLQNQARMLVEVPADAKVFVDGVETKLANLTSRSYITPPLERGRDFAYDVRVDVVRDGQTLSETQQIVVRAGEESRAVFRKLAAPAAFVTELW